MEDDMFSMELVSCAMSWFRGSNENGGSKSGMEE
jgi:hypothetical protein